MKGAKKNKNKKIPASNERQLSGDTGTILEYTNPIHSSGRWKVQFQGRVIEIVDTNTIV